LKEVASGHEAMQVVRSLATRASPLSGAIQLGFVVRDLDAALVHWTQTMGVGPFIVFRDAAKGRKVMHRGERTSVNITLCVAHAGDVQIELIHQEEAAESPFTEFLSRGGEGLHHLAFCVDDLSSSREQIEAAGYRLATSFHGADGEMTIAYFDPPPMVGIMVELMPKTAQRIALNAQVKTLCADWDGDRPVRHFENVATFLAA
jgi:methylmalonyl-CoA/ethylmalonyl-CoA epimerase